MRRVLVTGGGTGIGQAIALAFAGNGDAVTITGRREASLIAAAKGTDMQIRQADVSNEDDVAALFEGGFGVVIANAGIGATAPLTETSLADWNNTLSVNLTGVFLTFREALRDMSPGGRLIAVASTASLIGGRNIASYAASKHGVLGLVRSVAHEVARKGITCNAICPGFVDTEMADTAIANVMEKFGVSHAKAQAMLVSGNPMGRLIDVSEVASAALYLASEGASSVNGHALSISGGEI